MRPFRIALLACLALCANPARAFTDAELVDGFVRTVFGSEYPSWGWQSRVVKKFTAPVRFYVDDRSTEGRRNEALRFLARLPRRIRGLEVVFAPDAASANFRVFIVDRRDYRRVVGREVLGRASSAFIPGKCLVRVISGRNGIRRSDAVIVADEGEFLFKRCLVEEVLQGLGPANDDPTLRDSIFNDASRHASFTAFDAHILNMLYDPRVQAGARRADLDGLLPVIAADVRTRLRAGR